MFDRVQNIGSIIGNNNLIINGDVAVDSGLLSAVAEILLRRDLELLSQDALAEMRGYIDECIHKLLEQIAERKIEDKLAEFARPQTQFAFYSVLMGYAKSETQEQRDMLVDSMIEVLQESWDSTEKIIIDSAIEILPRLTPATLSTLGILQLRHQMTLAPVGFMTDLFFSSLTPLAEQMSSINTLEIEYLIQEKLIQPLLGLQMTASLEQVFLHNYDLFFRKPLATGVFAAYCREHPKAAEVVTDAPMKECIMWTDGTKGNTTAFCFPNSEKLKNTLINRHQDYIIPHVDTLMSMMSPFTEAEVRDYFIHFTPSWEKVFKLFSSGVFIHYVLSITGKYLGGKVMSKACHRPPMPLSNFIETEI